MPRVTVIIPTYNRADVLQRAIESVCAQTLADFELLVVDDGSTDDTFEIVTAYDDTRIRIEGHGSNRGANAARNTGIELARGEYVAFLDSDDEWRPKKLERQLSILENRSDDWVGAYCDFAIHAPGVSGRIQTIGARMLSRAKQSRVMEGGDALLGEILADNVHPAAGSTLLVRRDVAVGIDGFDETLDRFQDPEFVLRVLAEGKLAYVDEPLVVRHETSDPDSSVIRSANRQYLDKFSGTIDRLESEGTAIRGRHNFLLAKLYLKDGDFITGSRYLGNATFRSRHVPGLLWSVGSGIRQRRRAVLVLCVLLLLGALSWTAGIS